jgi:hypothetical protein
VFSAVEKRHRIFCQKWGKHTCHVAVAYPFTDNTDKFHSLQQLRLIYSVFCFVLPI